MAKIAVFSKNKTRKPEETGVDVGLLKVKDGRVKKKKTGKSDFGTGILSSNIKEAIQGTLTKRKIKKDKSSSLKSDESMTNGAPVTTDEVSSTKNIENVIVSPSHEVKKKKIKPGKVHSVTQLEKVRINGSTETVLDAKCSITESAEAIADTKQSIKKKKKQTKNTPIMSLDQSVSTEDLSVSTNPSIKVDTLNNVQTSQDAQSLPSENPTDDQLNKKLKMNKLGRFAMLKLIEETRKKKLQKINPTETTGLSSVNSTKISLDDLQPDFDDITDSLSISSGSKKSRKLSIKVEAANSGSFGENMGDSDTDSDNDDAKEDEAVCKSYKNDFGFDEVVDAFLEEKNMEEDKLEEQKLEEAANKKKKTERDVTEHERTIEVINVNIKTSKKLLLAIFKKFGKVESIRYRNIPVEHVEKFKINQIMKNTLDKKRSSMTAFVKFANTEAAKSALEANTAEVSGHHIIVRPCVRLTPHQKREELSKGCTVFIGNLPHVAEEESVYKHFESCGAIVNIAIMRNQLKATGSAFLEFKTKEAAAAALKLNDTELQRRTIRVTKAVRKVKGNKKHVQSSTSTSTRSLEGNGNKPGGRPFQSKAGANKQFTSSKQKPFQQAPGAGGKEPHKGPHNGPHKGPHNGAVRHGSVHSRLSRPNQPQGAPTSSTPSGAFTGNKFDQPQKGAVQRLKTKRTKEEVRKIMLAKKLTFKKPSV